MHAPRVASRGSIQRWRHATARAAKSQMHQLRFAAMNLCPSNGRFSQSVVPAALVGISLRSLPVAAAGKLAACASSARRCLRHQNFRSKLPSPVWSATRCCLTLRSSGPPPAWRREALTVIIRLAAPRRWRPLSSNVRPHENRGMSVEASRIAAKNQSNGTPCGTFRSTRVRE